MDHEALLRLNVWAREDTAASEMCIALRPQGVLGEPLSAFTVF
jgi:hypothetical protein